MPGPLSMATTSTPPVSPTLTARSSRAPAAAVTLDVARDLGDGESDLGGARRGHPEGACELLGRTPGSPGRARIVDGHPRDVLDLAARDQRVHFTTETVVPRPTSDTMSNSSTSRFAPPSPSPRPLPLV